MPRKDVEVEYSSVEEVEAEIRSLVGRSADLKEEIEVLREQRREVNKELAPLRAARRKLVLAQAEESSDDN